MLKYINELLFVRFLWHGFNLNAWTLETEVFLTICYKLLVHVHEQS